MPPVVARFTSPHLRFHLCFATLFAASVGIFQAPLHELAYLSQTERRYSHLLLIPLLSALFLLLERRRIFAAPAFSPGAGLPLLLGAGAAYWLLAAQVLQPAKEFRLSLLILTVALAWTAAFTLCHGPQALKAARFPFLLLILMAPVPPHWMDGIIAALQHGAAEASYTLFRLLGTPMVRDGLTFQLPGAALEIAPECSSIHSGWALFITSLMLGHLVLRSAWAKASLSALAIPVAMFTNGIRIVTLYLLAARVDPGFLDGDLHKRGGIAFGLLSLAILSVFLWGLRKIEDRGPGTRAAAV